MYLKIRAAIRGEGDDGNPDVVGSWRRREVEWRDKINVGYLDDPTKHSEGEEMQTLSRINSSLGLSSRSVFPRKDSGARLPALHWSRQRLNGTLTGLGIRIENRISIPRAKASNEIIIKRGRRHVSLHPIYNRNPLVL